MISEEFDVLGTDHALGRRRYRSSEMRRVHSVTGIRMRHPWTYRFTGAGRGRTHGSGRALGSRQPTSCTNFCGADWLPLSPHCCDIAPQIFGSSALRGFDFSIRGSEEPSISAKRSAIGWPGLRVGVVLPTSMLPLPTTAILC